MHLVGFPGIRRFRGADQGRSAPGHEKDRPTVARALDVVNAVRQLKRHDDVRALNEIDLGDRDGGLDGSRDRGAHGPAAFTRTRARHPVSTPP